MLSPRVRRILVLLAGYVAAAASAPMALVLYGTARAYIDQSGHPLARSQTIANIVPGGAPIVGLLLAVCLPFAWLPLTVGLVLWRRLVGKHHLLGCIVSGTVTGIMSNVWLGVVVGGISRAMLAEMLTFLVYAAPMGAFGGLVFWAIASRRDPGPVLKKTAAPPARGRAERESSGTSAETSPR